MRVPLPLAAVALTAFVLVACTSDQTTAPEASPSSGPAVPALNEDAGARAGAIPGQYIVVLKEGVDAAAVAAEHAHSQGAAVLHRYYHALKGYAARLSPAALAAIEHDERVRFVSEDREVFALSTCDASNFDPAVQCPPPGIDRIDGDLSSTRSGNGGGVVNVNVAVLDTGLNPSHPDLNVLGGVECTGGRGRGFDDQDGHGTHVAGIIGAKDNGIGVVGVAPGARLWAARVLKQNGSGSFSNIICGIDWATATHRDSDPSNDVAVANMSLGGKGSDDGNCGKSNKDAMHLAICSSSAAGVTYVVAAGNESDDLQGHVPAAYDEVLTATAMTDLDGMPGGAFVGTTCARRTPLIDDEAIFFSNFATLPADQAHTVAAPGVCILSSWLTTVGSLGIVGYEVESGTSMASPHVAGTVALCIASGACAGLTPALTIQKIVSDAAAYNIAHTGYGFVGDPIRPEPGKYYGFLIRAAAY